MSSLSAGQSYVTATNIAHSLRLVSGLLDDQDLYVRVRGVVAQNPSNMFLIVDESAGLMVFLDKAGYLPREIGEVVEVEGVTRRRILGAINARRITKVGKAPLPVPRQVSIDEALSGNLTSQWVRVEGVIRKLDRSSEAVVMTIASGRRRLPVTILRGSCAKLTIGSEAGVTGLCLTLSKIDWMPVPSCMVARSDDDVALAGHSQDPFSRPVRHIKGDTGKLTVAAASPHGVHVRGVVIRDYPGRGFALRDGNAGVFVDCPSDQAVVPGDEIDLYGFVVADQYNVKLEDVVFRKTGSGPPPKPVKIRSLAEALVRGYDLVEVEGVIDEEQSALGEGRWTVVRGGALTAVIVRAPGVENAGRKLQVGSLVRVSGICLVKTVSDLGSPVEKSVQSIQVFLRKPADLTILKLPSWWTPQHIAMVLGGVTGFLILVIVAGMAVFRIRLRREADQRFHGLAMEQERARIAKDMHDEVGFDLTRITRLAEQSHDKVIAEAARDAVQSMDEIVWAVNPSNDTLINTVGYFVAFAEQQLRSIGIGCRIDLPADLPDLSVSAEMRHNLFMVVKEAINNAVKHGMPKTVRLGFEYAGDILTVTVQDDGLGFDQQVPPAGEADGLNNMRGRMSAIGGEFAVQSVPGSGTQCVMRVRLKGGARP